MFTLPDLPYDYAALEPFIDTETMQIHLGKHHAAYIKNLNDALAGHEDLLTMDVNELVKNLDKVPQDLRQKVKNNAGGHSNHSLFWKLMCTQSESKVPTEGKLFDQINSSFGNFDTFKEKFSASALGHFGSGWAWLVLVNGKLEIVDTSNQDTPITDNKQPILGLDVWEHAYYLKYKNMRADYITAFWNIVNWKEVEGLYDGA